MIRYHNITKDDMLNGNGLRAVLWVAGCPHHCKKCHNPVTWDPDGGIPFDDVAKSELWSLLQRPYISGITFSGGDPLFKKHRQEILALASEIKHTFPEKDIWMYTGYTLEELIADGTDLQDIDVLVDGPFIYEQKDAQLKWCGSANQRVILLQEATNAVQLVTYPRWLPPQLDAESSEMLKWENTHLTEFLISPSQMVRLIQMLGLGESVTDYLKNESYEANQILYEKGKAENAIICERIINKEEPL